MEPVEAFHDSKWESLCGMFNFEKELDEHFMVPEIFGLHEGSSDPSSFFTSILEANTSMARVNENTFCSLSDPNSSDTVSVPDITTLETHHFNSSDQITITSNPFVRALPDNMMQVERKLDDSDLYIGSRNSTGLSENTRKKPRVLRQMQTRKNSKKNQKLIIDNNGDNNNKAGSDGQSLSSYSSDDEDASRETDDNAVNVSGKRRASRGAATDPQSLYARKRREKINERLKILQKLVPNGTKVDISTMLEEAVHYVKFLQLQIRLLSSDDLWRYAPLAYNGLDMGLLV